MEDGALFGLRTEPWTAWEWAELDLGDDADWRTVELDDGALVVSPSPSFAHDATATALAVVLSRAAPAGLVVSGPAGVELAPHRGRIPDVVVARASPALLRGGARLTAADVVLAVEVESPTSRGRDRLAKPAQYGQAGIPSFWRVEPEVPRITAYALRGGVYVEVGAASGADALRLEEPFPVVVVPTELAPGWRP